MTTPTILVCTDGSVYAPSIYQHAAWAALRMKASVHVLHMLNPHHENPVKTDLSGSIGFGAKSALLEELVELEATHARIAQKRGQAILDDAEAAFARELDAHRVRLEQKHGELSDTIGELQPESSLLVLGKRGNNANFAKGHLGSNLERVIRSCHCPVLVASRSFEKVERFLVAFDGGPSAEKAIQYLVEKPLLKGLPCHLLTAGKDNEKSKQSLKRAVDRLTEAGYAVTSELRPGEPEKLIGEVLEEQSIQLLVMGAYGHSHIRHLIVGSTTTAMMRKVRLPVLLFR